MDKQKTFSFAQAKKTFHFGQTNKNFPFWTNKKSFHLDKQKPFEVGKPATFVLPASTVSMVINTH